MISPSTMASESGSETPKLTRRSPERSCASSTTLIELDPMSSPTVVFFLPNMAAPSVGRDWRAPRYPRAAVRAHYFEQVPCHGAHARDVFPASRAPQVTSGRTARARRIGTHPPVLSRVL